MGKADGCTRYHPHIICHPRLTSMSMTAFLRGFGAILGMSVLLSCQGELVTTPGPVGPRSPLLDVTVSQTVVPFFGPETFIRSSGKRASTTRSLNPGSLQSHMLRVRNGNATGGNKISQAKIAIDGVTVLAVTSRTLQYAVPVTITAGSQLEVTLEGGSPGSEITVTIDGIDPTDMMFRTVTTVERDHRAIIGQPTPLDIDDIPGADVIATAGFSSTGISVALEATNTASTAIFSIQPIPDAVDNRRLRLYVDQLQGTMQAAFNSNTRTFDYAASGAMQLLRAWAGIGEGPTSFDAELRVEGVPVSFAIALGSLTSIAVDAFGSQLGLVEARARSTDAEYPTIPTGTHGVVLHDDGAGPRVALRSAGLRTLLFTLDPPALTVSLVNSGLNFILDVQTTDKSLKLELPSAPTAFTLAPP